MWTAILDGSGSIGMATASRIAGRVDVSRIANDLGWRPIVSFREGFETFFCASWKFRIRSHSLMEKK